MPTPDTVEKGGLIDDVDSGAHGLDRVTLGPADVGRADLRDAVALGPQLGQVGALVFETALAE